MDTFTVAATVHGHYRVRSARAGAGPAPWLLGFHGYGESAAAHLAALEQIPGLDAWTVVAVQALHPFYTRTGEIVASWMTSLDRELAIADNQAYVAAVAAAVARDFAVTGAPLVSGFSQGVAMAYRAAVSLPAAGVLALAGDIPPEIDVARLPPVLVGRGLEDTWYTPDKMAQDLARLRAAGGDFEVCEFPAGHVWHEDFHRAAAAFLARWGGRAPAGSAAT